MAKVDYGSAQRKVELEHGKEAVELAYPTSDVRTIDRQIRCKEIQKAIYGLGHVYNDLCAAMWFSYMLLFFQVILNMEPASAGGMLLLGQVVDALATPVVGILADRWSSKKVWHLTGTTLVTCTFPFIFIRCWGCWNHNQKDYLEWWMPLYYGILIVVFQIGWAFVQISHLAMIPDITESLQIRSELTSIRYTASVCSSITVYMITWVVFRATNNAETIGPTDDFKFRDVSIIVTVIGVIIATLFHALFNLEPNNSVEKCNGHATQNGKLDVQLKSTLTYFLKTPTLYYASLLYVFSRLYWALSLVYVPLFLDERLALRPTDGSETVASVPLVLYISSFFSSLLLKSKISTFGNQVSYMLGTMLSLLSSLWIALAISPEANIVQIYLVAALIGAGSSITLVSSLCITADLIGSNSHQGAAIYSIVTFADKLVTGIAVVGIENYKCIEPGGCPQYYRGVLTYACGGSAALGLLSLIVAGMINFLKKPNKTQI